MALATKEPDSDQKYNPATWDESTGSRLSAAEQSALDDIADNYDQSADDAAENSNIDRVRDEEASGGSGKFQRNFINEASAQTGMPGINTAGKAGAKLAKGPMGAIASALITLGIAISVFLVNPSIALSVLSNSITNTFDTASIANRAWLYKIIANKFHGTNDKKVEEACKQSPTSSRCKRGTVSDAEKEKLEKNNRMRVTLATGDFGGRNRIGQIEMLDNDGKVIGTARSQTEMRSILGQAKLRGVFNSAIHPSTAPLNDSRTNKLLQSKWNTSKSKVMTDSSDEKKLRASFRESANIEDAKLDGTPDERRKARESSAKKVSEAALDKGRRIIGKTSNPAAGLCLAYYGVKAMMAVAATEYMTKAVGFSMAFLREADRARAGQGSENVMTWLNDRLNYSEISPEYHSNGEKNRFYKTTAWDSQGMRYVVSGNAIALSQWSNRYIFGENLGGINDNLRLLETAMGGPGRIHQTCRTANSIASCVGSGGFIGGGACILMGVPPFSTFINSAVATLMAPIIAPVAAAIVEKMMAAPIDDSVKGIDAGDVIAAGGGYMLTSVALNRGAKLVNKQGYTNFVSRTAPLRNDMIADAKLEGKADPFNAYNQYSFLGSIIHTAHATKILKLGSTSNLSRLSRILTVPAAAIQLTAPGVYASDGIMRQGFSQPLHEPNDAQFSNSCPFLEDIGISGASGCVALTAYDERSLAVSIDGAIDFMEMGDYVDIEGVPKDTDNGKKYQMYLDYCIEGSALIGIPMDDGVVDDFASFMTGGIVGPDSVIDWDSKYNCGWGTDESGPQGPGENGASSQELAMFSAYTGHGAINDTLEDTGSSPSATPTGDMEFPVRDAVTVTSCHGLRPALGDMHYAIDIAGADGVDILAADSGEVTVVNNNNSPPFSGFGRTVVVKHGDLYTRYSHLKSITVKVGDSVEKGDVVGTQGGSGGSSGVVNDGAYPSHLDFGISKNPNVPNTADTENGMKYLTIPDGVSNPHGCSADYNGEAATKDDPRNRF